MSGLTRRSVVAALSALAVAPTGFAKAQVQGPLKVGFIYLGPISDHGWTYAHERGRKQLAAELGDAVQTTFVENVEEGRDCARVMRELAQQGHRLIFATSFGYMNFVLRVAQDFPELKFEHATGYQRTDNVATYNARFYQGRSVLGTIAGHMSKTGVIGYLASFPIPEVAMGINAFTLAAQAVNPDIVCKVVWANTWFDPAKEAEAAHVLINRGADVLTTHTDSSAGIKVAEKAGIIGFGQGGDMSAVAPRAHMTAIVDNWGPYYVRRAKAVLEGTWSAGDTWMGMAEGAITIAPYNPAMPDRVKQAAETVRLGILDGTYDPFAGPIKDQSGAERVSATSTLSDSQLLAMDWYVAGVRI